MERERKAKLQVERQMEERQKKVEEQRRKEEQKRLAAGEKRKQKQEEEKVTAQLSIHCSTVMTSSGPQSLWLRDESCSALNYFHFFFPCYAAGAL